MQGQPPDPSLMRISDEDRHKVSEVLRQAAGEGRIDMDELDQRLEATYQAKTYGELVPITVDLPDAGRTQPASPPVLRSVPQAPAGPLTRWASSIAIMSETRRKGRWLLEDGHAAFALMGSVLLDLREASFAADEVVVNANAVMGEVRLIVGPSTRVVVEGAGVMGEYSEQRAKVPFDAERPGPVVRVRGVALMGSVHVQRRGDPGQTVRGRLGLHGR